MPTKIEVRDGVVVSPGTDTPLDPSSGFRAPVGEGTPTPTVRADPTGGGMSEGFAAKFKEAQAGQQPQQQDERGTITKVKEWLANVFRNANNQLSLEAEREISGVEPTGDSMMGLLALSAAASAPFLAAAGIAGLGSSTVRGISVYQTAAAKIGSVGSRVLDKTKPVAWDGLGNPTAWEYKTTLAKGISTLTPSQVAHLSYAPKIANNAKTAGIGTKLLISAGLIYMGKEAWDSIVFGKFQINEGIDKLNWAADRARQAGAEELAISLENESDILADAEGSILMNIPWLSSQLGTIKNTQAAKLANDAYRMIREIKNEAAASGTNEYNLYLEKKLAMENASTDYYNEQRIITEQAIREAEREQRNDDAHFWRQHQQESIRLEEEERIKIAAFWIEYWKKKARLQAEGRGSNLNFRTLF